MSRLVLLALIVTVLGAGCSRSSAVGNTLKQEKEACTTDETCATGLCEAPAGQPKVCVRKCESGCKTGEVCTQQTPERYSCQPDPEGLCRPCSADTDCPFASDRCLSLDGIGVCGRDCSFDHQCPASYHCVNGVGTDSQAKSQQCVPTSGSCACTASTTGMTVSCEVTNGLGTCRGSRTCDGIAGYGACSARTPSAEVCNGVDDDCNGTIDDGQPSVTCGVGACFRRIVTCGDAGSVVCTPLPSSSEVCNGIDDDCDGVVDNGFNLDTDVKHCGSCTKACALANANPRCDARVCAVDTCKAGFGNCDGVQSNGCEADLGGDPNNCNACNHQCAAINGIPSCTSGVCTFACKPGFVDLDGDPSNGCEYPCTVKPGPDLPDVLLEDSNCDGMDGEVNNGIYVSPLGDDGNAGTASAPMRTIAAGISTAVSKGKRDVYVSEGTFTGPLIISGVSGVNVAGGYFPGGKSWTRSKLNQTIVTGGNPALSLTSANVLVQLMTFNGVAAAGLDGSGNGTSAYGAQLRTSAAALELVTIVAGNGVRGADGTDGSAGVPGGPGVDGAIGCTNDNTGVPLFCSSCARPAASTGGTSACGRPGGAGGLPGYKTPSNSGSTGDNGAVGQLATAAGQGGIGFSGGSHATPLPTQQGAAGPDGSPGANGAPPAPHGALTAAGFVPAPGGKGADGVPGEGGGGGGGGGGGCADLTVGGIFKTCWCFTYGSVGGSGGGGGCGGTAGTAGRSGGASIAMLLYDSQLQVKLLTLQSGTGGAGGKGGAGGGGAGGGLAGGSSVDTGKQGYSGVGGSGGKGGSGGAAGAGAGGAGGPSYGLLRNNASTINSGAVSYQLGFGGAAGPSAGNAGPSGQVAADQTL